MMKTEWAASSKPASAWIEGLAAFALGAIMLVVTVAPMQAAAQTRPLTQRVVPKVQVPTRIARQMAPARPSLARFLQIYDLSKGDVSRLRNLLVAENVNAKVQRLCYVPGQFQASVVCRSLGEIMIKDMKREAPDQAFLNFGFNDLWEQLGGGAGGGDLLACGGASAGSMTNLRAHSNSGAPASTGGSKAGVWASPGAAPAQSMVDSCRSAQKDGIRAGLGALYVPGSEGYRRAVGNAQTFLSGIGDSCGATVSGRLGQEQISNSGQAVLTGGETATVLSSATNNLVQGVESVAQVGTQCAKGKGSCAIAVTNVVTAAVGMAATGDLLTADRNDTLQTASAWGDVVGGATAFVGELGAASASTGFATVMPVASAFFAGLAVGGFLEGQLDSTLDPLRVGLADALWEWENGPAQERSPIGTQKGTMRPAEDGKPSCEAMAARAARFNAYCSQPGNNWQSYDCMLFVARLNGCADPGVIQPAPGEDFHCSAGATRAQKWQLACQNRAKLGSLLGNPGSAGAGASQCAPIGVSRTDLDRQLRERVCTRALTDDPNGFCGAAMQR